MSWLEDATLVGGEVLRVHKEVNCTPPCAIHAPSDHHMISWPQHWRSDRGIIERICECGIGHPDPDDLSLRQDDLAGVHGCCGHCSRKYDERPCGCQFLNHGYRVDFLKRCSEHAPMCRPLDDWEINLF